MTRFTFSFPSLTSSSSSLSSSSSSANASSIFSTSSSSENTNYLGESWLKTDLSKNRGFILTFKPELYAYESSITTYPEGFAIVFTASDPEKFNLGQNEGLGYEGIITGFALEFDFIQNVEKGDSEKPHLSFNYNINGIL